MWNKNGFKNLRILTATVWSCLAIWVANPTNCIIIIILILASLLFYSKTFIFDTLIVLCINSIFKSACLMKRLTTTFNPSTVLLSLNFVQLDNGNNSKLQQIYGEAPLHWSKGTARSQITEKIHCSRKFWDFNQFLGSFTVETASTCT